MEYWAGIPPICGCGEYGAGFITGSLSGTAIGRTGILETGIAVPGTT